MLKLFCKIFLSAKRARKVEHFCPHGPCICPILHFLISIYNLDEHVADVVGATDLLQSIIESALRQKYHSSVTFPPPRAFYIFSGCSYIFYIPGSRLTQLQIPLQLIKHISREFLGQKIFLKRAVSVFFKRGFYPEHI